MISIIGLEYRKFNFPKGETHVVIEPTANLKTKEFDIIFDYEQDAEIFELMLVVDAIRRKGFSINMLYMDYVPYGRQDRVANEGEPLSIKVFCDIINSLNFNRVIIKDAHSPVTTALLNNCYEISQRQSYLHESYMEDKYSPHFLISPDGGALKKIFNCRNMHTLGIIECSKQRDTVTGDITGTVVHHDSFSNHCCIIVDDICDGGRTFIEIAKVLKQKNAGKVILYVTHGFFTKGLKPFENIIDKIYTSKRRVK